jgi:hypothetical protein
VSSEALGRKRKQPPSRTMRDLRPVISATWSGPPNMSISRSCIWRDIFGDAASCCLQMRPVLGDTEAAANPHAGCIALVLHCTLTSPGIYRSGLWPLM